MKQYKTNPPFYKVTPFSSICEMINIAVDEAGDKTAFRYRTSDGITDVSYREFRDEIFYLGAGLRALGLSGCHIANIGDNSYRWLCVYLTALTGDNVFVPVDRDLPSDDILNILRESDAAALFYTSKYEQMLRSAADSLTEVKYFICVDAGKDFDNSNEKFHTYESVFELGKESAFGIASSFDSTGIDTSRLKMIVYTSGTTGMAKGVMLSEHNLVSSVYYGLQVSTVYDTSLSVLPYHHTYEAVSGILVSLHMHATICINESLRTVMKNLTVYRPSYIYLVPRFVEEFYKKIWANAKKDGKDKALRSLIKTSDNLRKVGIDLRSKLFVTIHEAFGGRLKKIVCGGAPIRPELGQFFESIGICLVNGYGITECSPLVSANRDNFNDCSTVGVPLPCCKIKFEGTNEYEDGEICVKGDVVMMGYYKNPELTAAVFTEDGYFRTGDYGRMNEVGQLIISGRKNNIIVLSNGKNVYPEEIEYYLLRIPYIAEAVVYPYVDENGSRDFLCAEVYLNQEEIEKAGITDAAASLKADIARICSPLPVYKQIHKIVIRTDEFEKTTSLKIKRSSVSRI